MGDLKPMRCTLHYDNGELVFADDQSSARRICAASTPQRHMSKSCSPTDFTWGAIRATDNFRGIPHPNETHVLGAILRGPRVKILKSSLQRIFAWRMYSLRVCTSTARHHDRPNVLSSEARKSTHAINQAQAFRAITATGPIL